MKEYILRKHCVQCKGLFCAGDMIFYTDNSYSMFICQKCSERENLCYRCHEYPVIKCGDGKHLCEFCRKELNLMPNIKITAEIDGKQVPLETVSTKTFEAIKALEKPKEIPIARVGNFRGWPSEGRLILKITPHFREHVAEPDEHILAIDVATGGVAAWWKKENDEERIGGYKNIKLL